MTKKIIMMLSMLVATLTIKAQTQKGNQLLGGSLSVNYGKSTLYYSDAASSQFYRYTQKTLNYGVGPVYSYFLANNLDLGISASYSHQRTTYSDLVTSTTYFLPTEASKFNSFSGAVYLRKYFLYNQKVGIRTGPFVQYQHLRGTDYYANSYDLSGSHVKTQSLSTGLGLDFVYFPTPKLGLTAALGSLSYSHTENINNSGQSLQNQQSDNLGLGFFTGGLSLSMIYAFGK